jgi:hypothetical protein
MNKVTINIVETPIMIIMGWANFSWNRANNSSFVKIGNISFSNLLSTLKKGMNTVIVFQEMSHSPSIRINFIFTLINPVILNSFVSLN